MQSKVINEPAQPAGVVRIAWRRLGYRSSKALLLGGLGGALVVSVLLAGCAGTPSGVTTAPGTWNGKPIGRAPTPNPARRQTLISRATREWEYFGRQTVVFKGAEESIPHVGSWEDEDHSRSARVNSYWRSVGKPGLDGYDCKQPWSAAFMSWLMRGAGVPSHQFKPASAHWVYLASMIQEASYPGRYFVPRRIGDYSPRPGDLVCAYRPPSRAILTNGYISPSRLRGMRAHCDLVVSNGSGTLDVIGGNVRNSVSRSTLEVDGQGRLKPVPRRPWFLVMENRM